MSATDDGAPVVVHQPETVPLRRLFLSFLLVEGTAFGGPAILRHMKEFTVKDRSWPQEEEFRAGIALGQVTPAAGYRAGGGAGFTFGLQMMTTFPSPEGVMDVITERSAYDTSRESV